MLFIVILLKYIMNSKYNMCIIIILILKLGILSVPAEIAPDRVKTPGIPKICFAKEDKYETADCG